MCSFVAMAAARGNDQEERRWRRRLALHRLALHRPQPASALARSADFASGAPVEMPADHPSLRSAPDDWKHKPDLESAARFTPSGVLTTKEQSALRRELRYFREHGCIQIPDAL